MAGLIHLVYNYRESSRLVDGGSLCMRLKRIRLRGPSPTGGDWVLPWVENDSLGTFKEKAL